MVIREIFKGGDGVEKWIHIDKGDGIFASVESWGDPVELEDVIKTQEHKNINIEAHLMVENPEDVAEAWLKAGVKRLIVHLEALKNVAMAMDLCQKYEANLMLAINPETIVENLIPYFHNVEYYLILAVEPGESGQDFNRKVLDKIEFLRERRPGAKIEVDGGINLETVKLVKEAGADYIVSASYIFEADDPKEAYRRLIEI